MMPPKAPYDKLTVFRPCLSTYVFCDGLCGIFLLGMLRLAMQGAENAWIMVSGLAFFLLLVHTWIAHHWVAFSDREIRYGTLFGVQSIAFTDIADVEFQVGIEKKFVNRMKGRGFFRIVFCPRQDNGVDSLVINATLFSKSDVQKILSLARQQLGKMSNVNT